MNADRQRLRSAYPEEKKRWDFLYPWIALVARPASFPIAMMCRRAGLAADHVTLLTAVLGVGGCVLLAMPDPGMKTLGAFSFVLYTIFDCVDGNLARAWPEPGPPVGRFWDQLVGLTYEWVPLALGIGTGHPGWIALGGAATAAKMASRAVRRIFWDVLGAPWTASKKAASEKAAAVPWAKMLYYNAVDIQGHVIFLFVAVLFGKERWYLLASAGIAAAEFATVLASHLRRSMRLRRSARRV